jgi:hypothetical protein
MFGCELDGVTGGSTPALPPAARWFVVALSNTTTPTAASAAQMHAASMARIQPDLMSDR